ncbi:glycolate oxidase subunit GlcE [Undibacter mobilis]|uniref:Glycolate oxidase subunit GlcE n=1 Tax=Undibacter mobilis TaxID=2292256 RepID=A0A371BBB2_9BRAD|nr:glycolate oxidase subunit GlcE [Undibacter mobilis]RDV04886.1 glycolate oxidase subunit GlcE [Undibacter mobilis]
MTDVFKPTEVSQVEEAVRWALGNDKAFEVVGTGSKRALGRPSQTDMTLDLSGLSGVMLYEPDELVLSARAGTPLAEIEKLLDDNNQQLDFEPMDYGLLLGQEAGQGTIGGTLAVNLSGPRRIKAGAARDHFLGATVVTGRGETVKTGGRVVKNVTGYDLCKVLAGSWGTLAAMTDVTIKVLPKPETEATVVVEGLDDAQACAAMAAALGSSCDVSAAAHLPDHVASYFDGLPHPEASTVLRLEGVAPSVTHRTNTLLKLMRLFGAAVALDETNSKALWRSVRQVAPFAIETARARPLWRISTAPAQAHKLVDLVTPAAQMFYDWGGGLVWVAMPFENEADAGSIRRAVAEIGGHATLVRAPVSLRASVDVFQPQEPGLAALSKRVKDSFDPKGVLNPGRMWAGV